MQENNHVVGLQDEAHWRYHVQEDRRKIIGLPTFTTPEKAESYIRAKLTPLFEVLALDSEQVAVVAAMENATFLLVDPSKGGPGFPELAPLPASGA